MKVTWLLRCSNLGFSGNFFYTFGDLKFSTLDAFISFLKCIYFQWQMLMVMMFGADGLYSPKESVPVSVEPLMPFCVG